VSALTTTSGGANPNRVSAVPNRAPPSNGGASPNKAVVRSKVARNRVDANPSKAPKDGASHNKADASPNALAALD
jgi:hypothetical protein